MTNQAKLDTIANIIQEYILQKYPLHSITRLRNTLPNTNRTEEWLFVLLSTVTDTFVEELQLFRKKHPHFKIILLTYYPNYTRLFRSHIGFWGVIDLKNYIPSDITSYIDEFCTK